MDRLSRMLAAAQSMGGMGGQQGVGPPTPACADQHAMSAGSQLHALGELPYIASC